MKGAIEIELMQWI